MRAGNQLFLESVDELNEAFTIFKDSQGDELSISFDEDWYEQYRKHPEITVQAMKDIAAHFPRLKQLGSDSGLISIEMLRELKLFKHLKSLSFSWSGLNRDSSFFKYIPDSLESLDLSRTVACRVHSTLEFKELLERLSHLKTLKLSETDLAKFPKLSAPNPHLETLELFHHTSYGHNRNLTGQDLKHISINFPNLQWLNISCPRCYRY